MKKIVQTLLIAVVTTVLFSCGHMHKGHQGKEGTQAHECSCSDAQKESCEHCKKGS